MFYHKGKFTVIYSCFRFFSVSPAFLLLAHYYPDTNCYSSYIWWPFLLPITVNRCMKRPGWRTKMYNLRKAPTTECGRSYQRGLGWKPTFSPVPSHSLPILIREVEGRKADACMLVSTRFHELLMLIFCTQSGFVMSSACVWPGMVKSWHKLEDFPLRNNPRTSSTLILFHMYTSYTVRSTIVVNVSSLDCWLFVRWR